MVSSIALGQGYDAKSLVNQFKDKKLYDKIDTDHKGGITVDELKKSLGKKSGLNDHQKQFVQTLLENKDILKKLDGKDNAFGRRDLDAFA